MCFSHRGPATQAIYFKVNYGNTENSDLRTDYIYYSVSVENKHVCLNLYEIASTRLSENLDINKDMNVSFIFILTRNTAEDTLFDNVWIGSSKLEGKSTMLFSCVYFLKWQIKANEIYTSIGSVVNLSEAQAKASFILTRWLNGKSH